MTSTRLNRSHACVEVPALLAASALTPRADAQEPKRGGTLMVGSTQNATAFERCRPIGPRHRAALDPDIRQPAALRRQVESAAPPSRVVEAGRGRQANHLGPRGPLDHGDQGQLSLHHDAGPG